MLHLRDDGFSWAARPLDRFCTGRLIVGLPDEYHCIPHPFMIGHITVLPSQASGSQSYGYGDLTNFYILVTGRELVALSALGLIVLVGLSLVVSRTNRKPPTKHS